MRKVKMIRRMNKRADSQPIAFAGKIVGIVLSVIVVLAILLPLGAAIMRWWLPAKESRVALNNVNAWILSAAEELDEEKGRDKLTVKIPIRIGEGDRIILQQGQVSTTQKYQRLCLQDKDVGGDWDNRMCASYGTKFSFTSNPVLEHRNELYDVTIEVSRDGPEKYSVKIT